MYKILFTGKFKKDYKKLLKRNLNIKKLETVYKTLQETGTLPAEKFKTHPLRGNWSGHYEAHIEPDWLIIWYKKDNQITLVTTGTHSDLF